MAHSFRTLQGARVAVHLPEPMAGHLANELSTILGEPRGNTRIEIGVRAALGDGFAVTIDGSAVAIAGGTPRRAMDGAYWLLEAVGAIFPEPGLDVPLVDREQELADGRHEITPLFPRRTLILGSDGFHDEWRAWLHWASRNRYDDIFFHDTPPSQAGRSGPRPESYEGMVAAGGGWLFERWDADGPEIVSAARERGMTLQFGGHHLATALPRELFGEHPEWFPLRNGVRDGRHNICTSNSEAMARIADGAAAFVERFAGADTYHLWADDIRGGGWCACDGCSGLSAADQALRMTNAMAAPLAAKGLKIAHLAYHDTLDSAGADGAGSER